MTLIACNLNASGLPRFWAGAYGWYWPHSHLCIRCRDQGFVREADIGNGEICHEHLTEDRINFLINQSGAWWS